MSNYFNIVKQLAITDFKLKYNCSFLGYFWSLIRPLIDFLVLFFVFSFIFKTGIENYPIYLFLGLLYWNFFSDSSYSGVSALVKRADVLKNVKVPSYIIVLSSSLVPLITIFLNLIIFLGIVVFFKISIGFNLLYIILTIFLLFILSFSVGLILSKFDVMFRDVDHIYSILLSVIFWLSPIVYSLDNLPLSLRDIYLLNPISRIIIHARDSLLLESVSHTVNLFSTILIVSLFFLVAVLINKLTKIKLGDYL